MRRLIINLVLILIAYQIVTPAFAEELSPNQAPASDPGSIKSLLQRTVGLATQPAVHRWRSSSSLLRLAYGQVAEFNNFDSYNWGVYGETPQESFAWSYGLRRIHVSTTAAARDLAMTPFKQAGHPSRYELSWGGKIPLMEAIASQYFNWIPVAQVVLSGVIQLHFHIYPEGWAPQSFGQNLLGLFRPKISGDEYQVLLAKSPQAMLPSRSRHSVATGLHLDQFYPIIPGEALVVSFSALVLTDVYQDESALKRWLEYQLGCGYDF